MTANEVKATIREMKVYEIDKLNDLANKSVASLMVVNFWYNAIKN